MNAILMCLGHMQTFKQGDYEKAMNYYEESLKIKLQLLGESHVDVAGLYDNIGVVHQEKGDDEKALEYHNKSLTIRLNTLGENHPEEDES